MSAYPFRLILGTHMAVLRGFFERIKNFPAAAQHSRA